ncbi:hypothetical protein [Streptomyces sp. NPDC001153]
MTIAYIAESAGVYRKPPKNRSKLVELVFRELESMWAVEIIRDV